MECLSCLHCTQWNFPVQQLVNLCHLLENRNMSLNLIFRADIIASLNCRQVGNIFFFALQSLSLFFIFFFVCLWHELTAYLVIISNWKFNQSNFNTLYAKCTIKFRKVYVLCNKCLCTMLSVSVQECVLVTIHVSVHLCTNEHLRQ